VIGDDRVKHEIVECIEPSHVSSIDSLGYKAIQHATLQVFPDAIPVPGILFVL
jgi:hypothetical protein